MKFKYNILNFTTSIIFVVAFICLLFTYLTDVMIYVTLGVFTVAFGLLTFSLFKTYLKNSINNKSEDSSLEMEISASDDGTETYVMKDNLKTRAKSRFSNFDKILPALLSLFVTLVFVFLIIKAIFQF